MHKTNYSLMRIEIGRQVVAEKSTTGEEEFCALCFIIGLPRLPREPTAGSILLQGPPKVGKSMFAKNFVKCFRDVRDRHVVYVTTDEAPDQLQTELNSLLGKETGVRIVDCYTWRTGLKAQGGFLTSSSANLNELSMTMKEAVADLDRPYLIFDGISSLAIDASEDSALKFLRILLPRIKMNRSLALFTVSEGLHSSSFLNALRTIYDGIIEMKTEEAPQGFERLVRVFAAKRPSPVGSWTKFYLTETGIKIGSPLYRTKFGVTHLWEHIRGMPHQLRVDEIAQEPGNLNKT